LLTFPNLQQRANFRTAIGDAIVTRAATEFRILAVVPTYRRAEIARQLAPLNANLLFVRHSAEASSAIRENDVFQVALLPASLTDTDWWELWGVGTPERSSDDVGLRARGDFPIVVRCS
jgi:hypothetical protein